MASAGPLRGGRAGIDRRARGVDVVDDADAPRELAPGEDASTCVAASLLEREAALTRECTPTTKRVVRRKLPDAAELDCERARRRVATLPCPLRVTGDGDQAIDRRRRNHVGHEARSHTREAASPALLPSANERSRAGVVHDRGACLNEREPPPRALGTSTYRPWPRRSAPLAHGWHEPRQRGETLGADALSRHVADSAALGQEEIECPHAPNVRAKCVRLRVRSAPKRARAGRPGRARGRRAS